LSVDAISSAIEVMQMKCFSVVFWLSSLSDVFPNVTRLNLAFLLSRFIRNLFTPYYFIVSVYVTLYYQLS